MSNQLPYDLVRRQAGVVHLRQLREAGVDPRSLERRVRSGEVLPLRSGLYRLNGAPTTWHQRIWEALLQAQSDAVVSHRTAARLHGIGSFRANEIDIVQVGNPTARLSSGDQHRSLVLPNGHRTEVDSIPVTTIERTIFDLAGQVSAKRRRRALPALSRRTVERALDDALSRGMALARVEAVLHELGGRGRGGTVVLRTMLADRGEGFVATESQLEDLLVSVLSRRGLPEPRRQRNLGNAVDRVGRVDFQLGSHPVIVEADGRRHHTQLLDQENDRWRDLEFAAGGFLVLRVTYRQLVDDPDRFLDAVEAVLRRHRGASA